MVLATVAGDTPPPSAVKPTTALNTCLTLPACAERAAAFLAEPPVAVLADDPFVFVAQKEYAVVPLVAHGPAPEAPRTIHWVGSAAATTCVIVAVQSASSVGVCHFDTVTSVTALPHLLRDVTGGPEPSTELRVWLVGAYCPTSASDASVRDTSVECAEAVVASLAASAHTVHLELPCILSLNTGKRGRIDAPRATSLVVDTRTGRVTQAVFGSYGPEFPLRSARVRLHARGGQGLCPCLWLHLGGVGTGVRGGHACRPGL